MHRQALCNPNFIFSFHIVRRLLFILKSEGVSGGGQSVLK
jgi:hypothetical protein